MALIQTISKQACSLSALHRPAHIDLIARKLQIAYLKCQFRFGPSFLVQIGPFADLSFQIHLLAFLEVIGNFSVRIGTVIITVF